MTILIINLQILICRVDETRKRHVMDNSSSMWPIFTRISDVPVKAIIGGKTYD
jgi:hypothetical protein